MQHTREEVIPFKWVYRIEVGKNGGIHIHMVCNRIQDSDLMIEKRWRKNGCVNYQHIYEKGGMKKLAAYIVKKPTEEIYEQICLFPEDQQKHLIKYSSSRNLIRPKAERKKLKNTPTGLLKGEPKPTKGYYIDKESVVFGINPITGKPYLHYIEYRMGYGEEEDDHERSKHLH